MATQLQIWNSALIKIGVEPVTSIDPLVDTSKATRLLDASYDMVRDDLLAAHYWNFAMERVLLSNTVGETPAFGFDFMYDLPADSLRIQRLDNTYYDFKIEDGKILTNLSPAYALYISKNTDTEKYSAPFTETLALRLAANLAYSLVQSVSLGEKIHALSETRLTQARSYDGQEGTNDQLIEDVWLDSRQSGRFPGNVVV